MKKRMILALVLAFALLCLACANDADDGVDDAEGVSGEPGVSVTETGTESSVDSTSSTDGTSGETSGESSSGVESGTSGTDGTDMNTSSVGTGSTGTDTSGVGTGGTSSNGTSSSNTSNASSNANGSTSNDTSNASSNANGSTSTGTESSGTGSGTSSESSTPAEGSENGGGVDTSSGSGNPNPSQTAHKHSYKTTVVKPTCTENGYTLHKCSCGDSYTDNEVPATGHDLQHRRTTVKQPTDTKRGIVVWICTNPGCDYRGEEHEAYSWNEVAKIEEERLLYWINKYRAEEGAPTLTMSKKLTELNEFRCEQSLQGGEHEGHNLDDIAKAAEATKCGTFHDYLYIDPYGMGNLEPHWEAPGQEAWSNLGLPTVAVEVGDTESIDSIAKRLATGFRASEGHWWYVGGVGESWKNAIYVGIGIGQQNCFVTVCDYNPDEKGYEHITLDENGKRHSEWVKD